MILFGFMCEAIGFFLRKYIPVGFYFAKFLILMKLHSIGLFTFDSLSKLTTTLICIILGIYFSFYTYCTYTYMSVPVLRFVRFKNINKLSSGNNVLRQFYAIVFGSEKRIIQSVERLTQTVSVVNYIIRV